MPAGDGESAEAAEPWTRPVREEERRAILDGLRRSPPQARRRAFTLHALEEWDVDDIARAQGRTPADVRNDIDAAQITAAPN